MNRAPSCAHESRKQVRGSSLLLAGRFFSLFLNLITQVLIVRYLIKAEYGAFAFALTTVEMTGYLATLGLNKACARFLPIYHERGDHERTLGTLVLSIATVLFVGVAAVLAVFAGRELLESYLVGNKLSLTLLLALIVLAPIEALDLVLESFFGAFGIVRVVFFRRHLIRPILKLATVVSVLVLHGSVETLAYCYVAASLLGFLYYIPCLLRVLRDERLREPSHFQQLRFPVGEMWRYCGPLLSSHVVFLFPEGVAILFLEMLSDSIAVAEYRAVIPFARLNVVVQMSFSLLFMPLASRFLSRNEGERIDGLYWDSVVWITVLTFPVFALTTVFAEPLTVLMLGPQYASASSVMVLLAVAFFTEATLGLTSQTLRVYARIRFVVFSDLLATAAGIVLFFLLIPRYGALGASVGSAAFRVVAHCGYMYFTHRATDVRTFAPRKLQIYLSAMLALVALVGVRNFWQPGWAGSALLITVAWLGLYIWNRRGLAVERVFPEIVRFPVLGRWFTKRTPELVNDSAETA